jgi:threonyl-tRNA synthetase
VSFAEHMFRVDDGELQAAMKPVSCPGHLQLARRMALSHRDLPLRMSELGLVHRNEAKGSMHGLFRLRQFTQDDGHVLCSSDQVEGEVARFCASLSRLYGAFGFDRVRAAFSSRPEKRLGDDRLWDKAEQALMEAAKGAGLECSLSPGEGAFYGPKLEFILDDRAGRSWQCGTIQLDFFLPERFGVTYADRDGSRRAPVMLHRAILGSLERFIGILLEHSRGRLPPWLAPEQVSVLPVGPEQSADAERILEVLRQEGLRVDVHPGDQTLSARVRQAHQSSVPFALVVGEREVQEGSVVLREGKRQRSIRLEHAVEELRQRCAEPL